MPENQQEAPHQSVLLNETISVLAPIGDGWVVDATVGFGGHSEAVLDRVAKAKGLALDKDESALYLAKKRLERFGDRMELVHSNFSRIKSVLAERSITDVAGVIADLGVSSMQLDSETRGFSFRFDAPLDMRMDPTADVPTAADLLETMDEIEIANVIYQYGE